MKITKEHFNFLQSEYSKWLAGRVDNFVERYETGRFLNSDKVKDLQTRLCFDILYAMKLPSSFFSSFYEYGNDEHLLTALKKIVPTVTKRY